jgi:general L-amino acid transport system permease protein
MSGDNERGGTPPPTQNEPSDVASPGRTCFVARLRQALFASPVSTLIGFLGLALVLWFTPALVRFLVIDAVWTAPDGGLCRAPGAGACWAYIARKLPYFTYGSYPLDQRWRVDVAMGLGLFLIVWLLWLDAPKRRLAAISFFLIYPAVCFALLHGWPAIGLPRVASDLWGGIFVSLLVAGVGIVVSLPLGVLLALGRRSDLPAVSLVCTGIIEFVRGVPIIAVLFMANRMLPLFLPESMTPDLLLRPLVGVAIFASAYMAEVIRGGLQAIPRGQYEASQALGLRFWQMQRLVVLPQALRLVIPGIVNTFIALFKDTTLVATVGIFDFLRTVDSARLDPAWAGPTITPTGYIFAAIFYFVFCFGMSRYSLFVERRLGARGNRTQKVEAP